jgi:hypothetical protein
MTRIDFEWCAVCTRANTNHWTHIRAHRIRMSAGRHVSVGVFVESVQ